MGHERGSQMETLELEITDLARGGSGVARDPSGRVIFVPLTLPGDRVRVNLVEADKRFAQAEVVELLRPSPERVEAPCPYFGWGEGRCGGCEWQHVPYALQWRTKVAGLQQALKRAGLDPAGIPLVELPAPEGERFGYRNRVQLRGEGDQVGFHARASQQLVPVERCLIARPELNAELPRLRREGSQLAAPYKVEVEVTEDGRILDHWNEKHAHGGFRQVHEAQNERLRQWVSERVPDGMRVLDLYGGDGNLSQALIARSREVHVVDLGKNAPIRMDVGRWLRGFKPTPPRIPTIAILDPPREGLGGDFQSIADNLTRLGVREILLVGCDPDAFARDASRFAKQGWRPRELGVLDFFPQTPHVESLAVLASG